MAYDKHTWTCDEPITVERLNHIEDGIANAGGECGYECEEGMVTLTEESVTTAETESGSGIYVGGLSYLQLINAETIEVTFNGTEYECQRMGEEGAYYYGGVGQSGPDFSEYPFAIISTGEVNEVYTETAGTYAIKIEMVNTVVTTTSCFDKARGYSCSETTEVLDNETVTTTHNDKGNFNIGYLNNFYLDEAIQKLTITFDNVEYECTHNGDGTYGSTSNVEFPTYPFQIYMDGTIYTSTDGEHSVKIEYVRESITASECFQKAVQFASSPLRILMIAPVDPAPSVVPPTGWSFDASAVNVNVSVPYNAIKAAYDAGRLCIVNLGNADVLLAPFGTSFRAMHTWSHKYIASAQDGSKDVWLCQTSDLQIHDNGTSTLTMTKAYYATTR